MLEKADCLLFNKLVDHVAEDGANSVEALISLTDVCEPDIIEEYLLNDKNRNCLTQL
jgi:hypothetical protein